MRIYKTKYTYPFLCGKCKNCGEDILAYKASMIKPNRMYCSGSCRMVYKNKTDNPARTLSAKMKNAVHAHIRFSGIAKSPEHITNMRLANLGEKSHFWKGGLTDENRKLRNSSFCKSWKKSIMARDKFTCVICGQIGGRLEVDHILPWCNYPEKRFDMENGRTLCKTCHRSTETFAYKATYNNGSYLNHL